MNRYFTTTVLPDMGSDGSITPNTTIFTANDILFDWHAFYIPRGANKLLSITMIAQGANGVNQNTAGAILDFQLLFAKDFNGVAPPTLGVNNAAFTGIGHTNHIIGMHIFDASLQGDKWDAFPFTIVHSDTNQGYTPTALYQNAPIILQGDDISDYRKSGYDRVYVAGVCLTGSTPDFGTGVLLNVIGGLAPLSTNTLTVDGIVCTLVFSVGDVIVAADGAVVGTIKSLTAGSIVLAEALPEALADNDELCFRSPLKFIMAFER